MELEPSLVLQGVALVAAIAGAAISICIYWKNARTRRAEWLYVLYAKFYEDDFYKEIRFLLDDGPKDKLRRLYECLQGDSNSELCEKLVDYLNFFEFMAGLREMKQLSIGEIKMLFKYYLDALAKHPPIMQFIREEGFENLEDLLARLRKADR